MPDKPLLPLATVQTTLGSPTRWAVLRELADGSSLMVYELAQRTQSSSSAISKQLAALISDGLVVNPRVRLFQMAPGLITDPANRIVDFGWCVVRFNTTAQ